jgi:hypothetical protein
MTSIIENGPDFWTSCGLRITTARTRLPVVMQAQDRDVVKQAQRHGWLLRDASPRWDTIWQPSAARLATRQVVILPARGFGMDRFERSALVLHRLRSAGLAVSTPDPKVLYVAEQIWNTRISPALYNPARRIIHFTGRFK